MYGRAETEFARFVKKYPDSKFVAEATLFQAQAELKQDRKSTRLNSSHTVIYTLSLHDALPIYVWPGGDGVRAVRQKISGFQVRRRGDIVSGAGGIKTRSEEHTSELQSHSDLHSFPTRRSSDLCMAGRRRSSRGSSKNIRIPSSSPRRHCFRRRRN